MPRRAAGLFIPIQNNPTDSVTDGQGGKKKPRCTFSPTHFRCSALLRRIALHGYKWSGRSLELARKLRHRGGWANNMGIKANLCNVQQVLAVLSVPPFPLDRALQVTSSCFGSFGKHCHGKGQNLILFHPSVLFGGWEDGMVGNTLPGACQPASQPATCLSGLFFLFPFRQHQTKATNVSRMLSQNSE